MQRLESPDTFPTWLKRVYGGREECPDTHKIHYQGALQCRSNVRMSQIKSWLPTAHLEIARSADALKKYAMKEETAVGEKKVIDSVNYWPMERTLCELGKLSCQYDEREFNEVKRFWMAVKQIVRRDPPRVTTLANPAILQMWKNTYEVWEDQSVRALVLQPEPDVPASGPRFVELNSPDNV